MFSENSIQTIFKTALDSKFVRFTTNDDWKLGQDAVSRFQLSPDQQVRVDEYLAPAAKKIMRISPILKDLQQSTAIGGLCSAMSGDQNPSIPFYQFLRMDQITETVGITRLPTLIVVEDSFFAALRGTPLPEIKKQTQEAEKRLQTWSQLTSGANLDLSVVLTSDPQIGKGLKELVKYFSDDVLRNPNFGLLQRAPVLLMYTSYWPELLTSLGILKSPQVICLEPTNHFHDEGSRPTSLKLNYAYQDFTVWLKDNPPGKRGRNKKFLVAGYLEAIEDKPRKKITRMLPFESVPNTLNWPEWNNKIFEAIKQFPFPLESNLIFSEAINWGLWNEPIVDWLNQLVILQADYKWDKAMARNNDGTFRQVQQRLSLERKERFYIKAKPLLQNLAAETANILAKVLGPQQWNI